MSKNGDKQQNTVRDEEQETSRKEELELLISLTSEYAKKLDLVNEKLALLQLQRDSIYTTSRSFLSLLLLFGFLGMIGWGAVYPWIPFLCLLIVSSVLMYFAERNLKLLQLKGKPIYRQLEQAVRTTSQYHEHVETNLGRRLELDLILTVAEVALEDYERIINQQLPD